MCKTVVYRPYDFKALKSFFWIGGSGKECYFDTLLRLQTKSEYLCIWTKRDLSPYSCQAPMRFQKHSDLSQPLHSFLCPMTSQLQEKLSTVCRSRKYETFRHGIWTEQARCCLDNLILLSPLPPWGLSENMWEWNNVEDEEKYPKGKGKISDHFAHFGTHKWSLSA